MNREDIGFAALIIAIICGAIWGIFWGLPGYFNNTEVKQCIALSQLYSQYEFKVVEMSPSHVCYVFVEDTGSWLDANNMDLIVELAPQ